MIWVDHIAGRYYLTLGNGSISTYLDSGRTPTVDGYTLERGKPLTLKFRVAVKDL